MKTLVIVLALVLIGFLAPQAWAGSATTDGCSMDRLSSLQMGAAREAFTNAKGDIQRAVALYRLYSPVVERYCDSIVVRDGQLYVFTGGDYGADGIGVTGGPIGDGGGNGISVGNLALNVTNTIVGGVMIGSGAVLMSAGAIIGLGVPNPQGIDLYATGYGLVLGGIVVAAGPAGFNGGGSGGACQCGDPGNGSK